jgi:hypothetical protein
VTEYSYPNSTVPNGIAVDESKHLIMAPDAIVSGLNANILGSNQIRLPPGTARVGGWAYENTANLDFTVATNTGGATRGDLLVLRKTWDAATDLVQVRAAYRPGGAVLVWPGLDTYPQTRGDGSTWEIPVARWGVAPGGSSAPVNPITCGPGPGTVSWEITEDVANNTLHGWTLPYRPTSLGNHSPQPVSWTASGNVCPVRIAGFYFIDYSVYIPGASAATDAWLRLDGPAGRRRETAFDDRSRAQLNMSGWMEAGENIYPHMLQNLGSTKAGQLSLSITRI